MTDNSGSNDKTALQNELVRLRMEHRDLDSAIASMADSPAGDPLRLSRLKKKKLELKDRIKLIEDKLLPDIIA